MFKPLDSYTTALIVNEAHKNDNNWGRLFSDEVLNHYRDQDLPWLYPNTDWQALLLKKVGWSHKYNVNISGGTDFARVFASVSYLRDGDVLKTEKQPNYDPTYRFDRYNYRFNIDLDLTKTTVLSLDAGGFIGFTNSPFENNNRRRFRPIYVMGPMAGVGWYPAEVLDMYPDTVYPDETGLRLATTMVSPNAENPLLANNYSGQRSIKRTDLNSTIGLKQDLSFITKGLSVNAKVAYSHNMAYERTWSYNAVAWKLNTDGSWTRVIGRDQTGSDDPPNRVNYGGEGVSGNPFRSWYFEGALNYARTFGDHSVSGLLLGNRRKRITNVQFPRFDEGVVGRVTYEYAARYLMEVNMAAYS